MTKIIIMGRPNVGKSSLFNYLVGQKAALVKNESGVTRDIRAGTGELWGKEYQLFDSGGVQSNAQNEFEQVNDKVIEMLYNSDLAIVVVDGRQGLLPEDEFVVDICRKSSVPFVVLVNKVDSITQIDEAVAEFYALGADYLFAVSVERRTGFSEFFEWLFPQIETGEREKQERFTLAVIGKPNVGKSSLVNRLLGENSQVVSATAGTTTDAILKEFQFGGETFGIWDTAGLKRISKTVTGLGKLSSVFTLQALEKCDLALILVDVLDGPSEQDAKMVSRCLELDRPFIIVGSRMDLAKDKKEMRREFVEKCQQNFHFLKSFPYVLTSAKTGQGLQKLFEKIKGVREKLQIRISTAEINEFFEQAVRKWPPPMKGTRVAKFRYVTQTKQRPPSFIVFVNDAKAVHESYKRYLVNQIQENWDLKDIPVRLFFLKKSK